jgi:nucleotide-binding universal stress UspA family protein
MLGERLIPSEAPVAIRKIERILCPIDDLVGDTDQALRYAVALARSCNARLFILHCEESISTERNRHVQTLIEDLICPQIILSDPPKLEWEPIIVEGDAASIINREAAERQVDLIVIRSKKRLYASMLLGSVTDEVCRTASCPVLILHPFEREWVSFSTNQIDLQNILVASDFSECSELALSYALSMASQFKARVHLLHVTSEGEQTPGYPIAGSLLSRAARRIRQMIAAEPASDLRIEEVVRTGEVAGEVVAYASEYGIDLICIGAHGNGFSLQALFGSNVERIVREAPCPVLIAHPLRWEIAKS